MEKTNTEKYLFGLFRIALGWIFFWAFLTKMFGLGWGTESGSAVIDGAKQTQGYLAGATAESPFHGFFESIAGDLWVEILFIGGLGLIGLALILGIGVRIAGYSGSLMMVLMYMAGLPLANNPILDEHLIYMFALLYFAHSDVGKYLGLGAKWEQLDIVQQYPILQ